LRKALLILFLSFVCGLFAQKDKFESDKYTLGKKNPYRAVFLSAIIPGGGQIYNKSYLKGFVFMALNLHHLEKAYEKNKILQGVDKDIDEYLYEKSYEKRQKYIGWIVIMTLYSMMDAFVDAKLYNFTLMKKEIEIEFSDQDIKLSYNF